MSVTATFLTLATRFAFSLKKVCFSLSYFLVFSTHTDSMCSRRLRHEWPPHKAKIKSHQQNRPLPPRSISRLPHSLPLLLQRRNRKIFGLHRSTYPTINDHLQATRNRWSSPSTPRLYVLVYRPSFSSGLLVCSRGRNSRERLSQFRSWKS